jgi:hypothetical protein
MTEKAIGLCLINILFESFSLVVLYDFSKVRCSVMLIAVTLNPYLNHPLQN